MGCVCCSLSSFISIVLDALERISLWTVCAMLTCCLTCTIITLLSIGIGIGYHYCNVQTQVAAMAEAAQAAGALRSGQESATPGHVMRSIDKVMRRGFAHRIARREMDGIAPPDNNLNGTLVVQQKFTQPYQSKYNTSLIRYLQNIYQ
ncbi:hypothetical protein K1T71_007687 [Dendrolimus kikuchii]|uniref:Uncharacterized protein n=1 Tax=Dendrolimus kikuchii TaxID=765133 RepID=A0ACC1CXY0_9NEOP|nr:hypothetical protein K1T71_007687 [Dendrolimus kikuchii]